MGGQTDRLTCAVECRASESGPVLRGVVLAEGRAATGGRAELFTPGSCVWAPDGIDVLLEHRGRPAGRVVPTREGNEIRIAMPAGPDVFRRVQDGARFLSIEFHALAEVRTAGGVREVQRAFLSGAALTDDPEYGQARAEVRTRRRRWWL